MIPSVWYAVESGGRLLMDKRQREGEADGKELAKMGDSDFAGKDSIFSHAP